MIFQCFGFQMSVTVCMLFVRCVVVVAVAAAAIVDIVVVIIVSPLPFVCAILEIDVISVF